MSIINWFFFHARKSEFVGIGCPVIIPMELNEFEELYNIPTNFLECSALSIKVKKV